MKLLIKNVTIVDDQSPVNGKQKDLVVENGKISFLVGNHKYDHVIEGENLFASIGWFDMRVTMGEPGMEHKEDIQSICKAAAHGGFTGMASMPNTKPSIQTKDAVAYIKSKTENSLVEVFPIASVTLSNKGEELTEMIDLHHAGAVAFTDGDKPIWHTDVLLKALQYTKTFNGLVINHAEDKLLTHGAQMHEGITSTQLGLKGFPNLAEELMVARDIKILSYTGGRLHFAHISSPGSLELIKQAKKNGLQVSCDIAAYQLAYDEQIMSQFDTNYKVNPPLRTKEEIKLFWKAIEDDTIDAIVSDHIPQDIESKNLEFDLAEFGMSGIETFLPTLLKGNPKLQISKIISKFTSTPRKLLGVSVPKIEEGERADLTIFSLDETWDYNSQTLQSKSKNSPLYNQTLKGKCLAVIKGEHFQINH